MNAFALIQALILPFNKPKNDLSFLSFFHVVKSHLGYSVPSFHGATIPFSFIRMPHSPASENFPRHHPPDFSESSSQEAGCSYLQMTTTCFPPNKTDFLYYCQKHEDCSHVLVVCPAFNSFHSGHSGFVFTSDMWNFIVIFYFIPRASFQWWAYSQWIPACHNTCLPLYV